MMVMIVAVFTLVIAIFQLINFCIMSSINTKFDMLLFGQKEDGGIK